MLIEYHKCKGHPDVRHVDNDCNGELAVSGTGWVQLPTGFGFKGRTFVVDALRYSAYSGFCMKCRTEGTFVRVDKKGRKVTKTPRRTK